MPSKDKSSSSSDIPLPMLGRKTEWLSILMGTWMSFISSAHFSLYFTSLWPFMKMLDASVTEAFFGTVVASYSLAQIIASPLFGIWANRIERLRPPLCVCNLLMFTGNWLYFLVELLPRPSQKFAIMVARFVIGTGSCQISLLRAHASAASTLEDRSRATALVTGGVAIGLAMGPAFQICFSWLGYPGLSLAPGLHLSMFNAPALFGSFLNMVNVLFLWFCFRESSVGILQKKRHRKRGDDSDEETIKLPPPDQLALWLCYGLRFTQQFIITNLETIGSSFAMLMFLWTPREVVVNEALAHSARGLVALGVYIVYIVFDLGKRVNDRLVCLFSLGGLLLFHVLTFSWPFLPNPVPAKMMDANGTTGLGCDRQQRDWCEGLRQVQPLLYYCGMVLLIGSAFPLINVSMNTLFSKVIGPRMQAKQQGLLQMCGGTGRMLDPMLIGFLYTLYGPRVVWLLECAVIMATGLLWAIFYRRLVPLKVAAQLTQISTVSSAVADANGGEKMKFDGGRPQSA